MEPSRAPLRLAVGCGLLLRPFRRLCRNSICRFPQMGRADLMRERGVLWDNAARILEHVPWLGAILPQPTPLKRRANFTTALVGARHPFRPRAPPTRPLRSSRDHSGRIQTNIFGRMRELIAVVLPAGQFGSSARVAQMRVCRLGGMIPPTCALRSRDRSSHSARLSWDLKLKGTRIQIKDSIARKIE